MQSPTATFDQWEVPTPVADHQELPPAVDYSEYPTSETISENIDYSSDNGPFVEWEILHHKPTGETANQTVLVKIEAGTRLKMDDPFSGIPAEFDKESDGFVFRHPRGHTMHVKIGTVPIVTMKLWDGKVESYGYTGIDKATFCTIHGDNYTFPGL